MVSGSPVELHFNSLSIRTSTLIINKAKRFAKQQRSNVQVLPCVYCYFLTAEQTAHETKLQCSGVLLTAADRCNYSGSPNTRT